MTGSGGNGKSKFVGLMLSVLGQYAGSLASTALTRKRPESGAANPDIMSIKGSRFVEVKEPDEGEPLNTARMKQFSGEDLVEARGLFKDQEKCNGFSFQSEFSFLTMKPYLKIIGKKGVNLDKNSLFRALAWASVFPVLTFKFYRLS